MAFYSLLPGPLTRISCGPLDQAQRLYSQREVTMAVCESCGRDGENVVPYTRPTNGEEHGEPRTLQLCPLCEASTPDSARVTRK
jgi:hypothetical protein